MRFAFVVAAGLTLACGGPPPPSQFPTARDALDRMKETFACSSGIRADAKVDYLGDEGRLRGNVLFLAVRPAQLRFDVYSPFGVTLSTFTSNATQFSLFDLKAKQYLHGPAKACNVALFTGVPVPAHVLAQLLSGEAPVLVHEPSDATIAWERGEYVVRIQSKHGASQRICMVPNPDDWNRPWQQQRIRVKEVSVEQLGYQHYVAELGGHQAAMTAGPDPDDAELGIESAPAGPACAAEVPMRMRIEMPELGRDIIFQNSDVVHNPPVTEELFRQNVPGGVSVRRADCPD